MNNQECQKLIFQLLGGDIIDFKIDYGHLYIKIKANDVLKVLTVIATNSSTSFISLFDLFVVNYNEYDCLYYQLHSFILDKSIFVFCKILNNTSLQSVTLLFQNAAWYEREAFEKFGIRFINHPDLRPILSLHD